MTRVTCHCGAELFASAERWGPEIKYRERKLVAITLPEHAAPTVHRGWMIVNGEKKAADLKARCEYSGAEVELP